jgi:DNA-binding PadR family transcriptional regulator
MGKKKDGPRMSPQTLAMLNVLLDQPADWKYGLELIEALGIKGGTVYPTLARLERFGWLESRREQADPSEVGRPRRKHYRLTGEGQRQAESALERWRSLLGEAGALPRPQEARLAW